jgi:ribosomal protein L7/L12
MSEITKDDVVKFIEGMTVLELSQLVKELEAVGENRPLRPRRKLNLMPF